MTGQNKHLTGQPSLKIRNVLSKIVLNGHLVRPLTGCYFEPCKMLTHLSATGTSKTDLYVERLLILMSFEVFSIWWRTEMPLFIIKLTVSQITNLGLDPGLCSGRDTPSSGGGPLLQKHRMLRIFLYLYIMKHGFGGIGGGVCTLCTPPLGFTPVSNTINIKTKFVIEFLSIFQE